MKTHVSQHQFGGRNQQVEFDKSLQAKSLDNNSMSPQCKLQHKGCRAARTVISTFVTEGQF